MPVEPVPAPYDWKKTLKAGAKVAVIALAGTVLADSTGLTQFILTHLPEAYRPVGGVLIAYVIAAIKNYISNAGRPA